MAETIRSIVGCNAKTAAFFLEISGGDISRAIEMYYEQQVNSDDSHTATTPQSNKQSKQPAVLPKKTVVDSPPWIKVSIKDR